MDFSTENTHGLGIVQVIDHSRLDSLYQNEKQVIIVRDGSDYKGLYYYIKRVDEIENKKNLIKKDGSIIDNDKSNVDNDKSHVDNDESNIDHDEPNVDNDGSNIDEPSFMDNFTTSETKYLKSIPKKNYDKYRNLLETMFNEKDIIPYKFKILNSSTLDIKTKKYIIEKLDKFNMMEENDNEYHKLDDWLSQLKKIPFDLYTKTKIYSSVQDCSYHIKMCKKYLDDAVFGHDEAKREIIQVFAQYITNPRGNGRCLALQGPMGNGKTTLIKEGLSKALGKPFYFIGLGGATNCSFLNGHSYTWEGSKPGIIVQALQKNNVFDGIIYFDELDKVSKSEQGSEIYNCLCHITDSSQNSEYQDRYFSNINLDLSNNLFVFSFNDKSQISPILLDRLNIINTKGFNTKEKTIISKEHLIPKICQDIGIDKQIIIFSDDIISYIITHYTQEDGVRTLKQYLEKIISYLNLVKLLPSDEKLDGLLKTKKIEFPININKDIVDTILTRQVTNSLVDSLYL